MIYNLAKITDVASIVSGNTPSGIDDLYEDNGEIPFFRVSDMNSFGNEIWMNSSTNSLSIENAKKLKLKICEAGTVIFPKRGGAIFTNKKRILSKPSTYDLNTMGLVPNEKVQTKYFFYWFNSLDLSSLADGSSVPQLNNKQILPLQIPLPPLPQQQKISNILDAADALRQNDKALIAKYDELTQALFLDMFGDPVSNPKGWEKVETIKYCDSIVPGRDKPKSFTGTTPWVTTNDLNHLGKTSYSKSNIGLSDNEILQVKAKIIPEGSVIMTCVGDLGVITVNTSKMVVNQQLHAFICGSKLKNVFLMYSLSFQKPYMYKMSSSTTVPYMNKTVCNNTPSIVPPIDLQNQFAERVAVIEEQKAIAQMSLEQSESLFNSLLQKAFKGELV